MFPRKALISFLAFPLRNGAELWTRSKHLHMRMGRFLVKMSFNGSRAGRRTSFQLNGSQMPSL